MNDVVEAGGAGDALSRPRRARGDRGSAVVTALVLLFAFTAGGVIWLSRDVNRVVANRSAAQSIAFQSARAGAQQVSIGSLRSDASDEIVIDEPRARDAVGAAAARFFESYGVTGSWSMVIVGDTVRVTVTIEDAVGDQTATGSVQARTGP